MLEKQATAAIALMSREEAQQVCDRIDANMGAVREDLIQLQEREGWRALGYESFRECVTARFGHHQSYLYRQLTAARVEQSMDLPIGTLPEAQARELAKLPSEARKPVYEALPKPTAAAIRELAHDPGFAVGQAVAVRGSKDWPIGTIAEITDDDEAVLENGQSFALHKLQPFFPEEKRPAMVTRAIVAQVVIAREIHEWLDSLELVERTRRLNACIQSALQAAYEEASDE